MPWALVGIGRKAAPALDPHDAEYGAFWHRTLALVDRFATATADTDEAQHLLDSLPDPAPLRRYPNCALFGSMGGRNPTTLVQRAFLYGAPLTPDFCHRYAALYAQALRTITPPRDDVLESWQPVPFAALADDADTVDGGAHSYRIYKLLVLRCALLLRCIKEAYTQRTSLAADTSAARRAHFAHIEQQMYHWLDAHLLLMVQIDELGHVPHDESPAMAILLERYAPNVHTAFTEAELPDLAREIERSAFFTQSSGARKEDALIYTFSKALPHRCEVREVAVKVAEVSAHNAGYFAFIKIALASMYLGIYRRCNYRAGWRLRYAIYRLFFASMDRRLLAYRVPRRRADGTALPLGGSAAVMQQQYNLHDLCSAVLSPLSPNRQARAIAANTRLQYTSYTSIVAQKYAATVDAQRKQTAPGGRKKSATEMRGDATRRWHQNYVPTVAAAVVPADTERPDNMLSLDELRAAHVLDTGRTDGAEQFASGQFVANAMARMTYEKNCGIDYYEQRLSAGTLPASGITFADHEAPAPKPVPPGTTIDYKTAFKGVLPCDRELPSEEALQRDCIIYHWISTVMMKDKPSSSGSKRKAGDDDDDDGEPDEADDDGEEQSTRKKSVEREYIFQNAINLAVREYLIFALERWLPALRHELCGRVSWASWEESVVIFGDGLRCRLDTLYVEPCPLGAFLTSYSAYQWMTNAARSRPINNHYTSEREPFLAVLKKLMKAKINNGGYGDAPVDAVVPRETEILIQHLLQSWQYPRVAPPLALDDVPRASASEDDDEPASAEATVFEQYHEKIVTPQLVYLIEPVAARGLPADVVARGATAVRDYIRTEYVERARFPLGIFHASDETLERFAHCRTAYHLAPSDPVVREFVNWLAASSAYQFYLVRTYCKVIERYMEIHTEPLPRHIAAHQLRTLRAQFCVPDTAAPPRHLMRTLICLGCKRCAAVFPSPTQRHSAMAIGNDDVRFVARTDDDEVYERVRARGYLPLPYEALEPAASWTEVLQLRSTPTADVYDRYCRERTGATSSASMPLAPEPADLDRYAANLFADTFSDANRERFASATDRRALVYDAAADRPDPRALPLQPVARGRGRLGELDFNAALWAEVDRRMRLFDGTGADNTRSFLLLGHSIEGADTEHYDEVKWCDTTPRIKAESKKTKQAAAEYRSIMAIGDVAKREQKLRAHQAKRRRNAESMARYALCSRRRMLEIDFLGRSLRSTQLYLAGRSQTADEDDCVLACCDCLARIVASQARAIGDRVVCAQCYTASKHSGGIVAQRAIRGESTKSVSATTLNALDATSAVRTRSTPLQTQLSPSFSALCSEVVPLGTCCAMDRCKTFKTDEQQMYGLEVLLDTSVGNETYAYVYFCAKHARMYARTFRVVTKLPFSTLKLFMMQNRRDFAEVVTRGSYLDDVMRRAAHSSGIGTQARADDEHRRQRKTDASKQRRQRMLAVAESARQRADATSAIVDDNE